MCKGCVVLSSYLLVAMSSASCRQACTEAKTHCSAVVTGNASGVTLLGAGSASKCDSVAWPVRAQGEVCAVTMRGISRAGARNMG